MPDPDAAWNKPPPRRESRWRRFTAALPMRTALIAVGVVWLLGCVWSYQEQSEFAASKGFSFPHLLPLVIDGFAVSMAGVSWAASLDARPAIPARLATIIAVGASSASNGVWAYLRANHDMVTVVLGVAVPIAANLAFEVLLAELRRQVQRRRGLPPPVAVPYPRMIRMALAPWQTFRAWRALVLEITAMEHTTAPRASTQPEVATRATAEVLETRSDPPRSEEPVTQPNTLSPPHTPQALPTTAVFTAPVTFTTPVGPPKIEPTPQPDHEPARTGSVPADYYRPSEPEYTGNGTARYEATPYVSAGHEPNRYEPTEVFDRPAENHGAVFEPEPGKAAPRQPESNDTFVPPAAQPATATARPSSASQSTAQREPTVDTSPPEPAASPASPPPARTTTRRVTTPSRINTGAGSSNGSTAEQNSTTAARNGSGRPIDRRVEQLAQHLATAEDADVFTGEMVGPLLNIDVAPRTGRRLLGAARELLERRAEVEANGENDPELSVIGGR